MGHWTVNVRVTTEAAAPHDAFIRFRPGSQGLPGLQVVRMQEIGMALLAEEGTGATSSVF